MQDTIRSADRVNGADLPLLSCVLLFDSMHFIFARLLVPYVSPDISAAYVMGIAAVQVGLYGLYKRELTLGALRKHLWFFLTIGTLIGFSTYLGYLAVTMIDPGTASMLGKISTIFSVALGILWLGERFAGYQLVGALAAIGGSFLIAYQPDVRLQWGALLIVFGTFCYAAHFAVVKRYGSEMGFIDFFFYRLVSTSVILFLVATGRQVLDWPTTTGWWVLLLTATCDVTISRAFYYWALRRLNMSLLSVITTLSPAVTILWALLFFGTFPTTQQLIGGIAVMLGVFVVTYQR